MPPAALAGGTTNVDLPGGAAIPVDRHRGTGESLLLWLPSEHGVRPPQGATAEALARRGVETWVVDLHSGYFVPTGRSSMDAFPVEDMVALLREARRETGKRVFLAGYGLRKPVMALSVMT